MIDKIELLLHASVSRALPHGVFKTYTYIVCSSEITKTNNEERPEILLFKNKSKSHLAKILGLSRPAIAEHLKILEEEQFISTQYKKIIVLHEVKNVLISGLTVQKFKLLTEKGLQQKCKSF